jgi:ADP-ribose pyrophosphatase YjhB (NUDIX family)
MIPPDPDRPYPAAMDDPAAPPSESPLPLRPVLGVSVSVWRGPEVLLIRRGRSPGKGLWSPVGGKVEFGERLEAAALREVREETGVVCALTGMTALREVIAPGPAGTGHHVVLVVFGARYVSGEAVAGDDAEAVRWTRPEEFSGLAMVEGVEPYILATRAASGATAP